MTIPVAGLAIFDYWILRLQHTQQSIYVDYSSATFVELHEGGVLTGQIYGGSLPQHQCFRCEGKSMKSKFLIDLQSPLSVNRRQAESGPDPRWPELFNPFHFWRRLLPLQPHTAPGC